LLGNLYGHQCAVRRESINVLGATSGDTGAAAIPRAARQAGHGDFHSLSRRACSPLQERQMACTGATNVFALAVDGSFDDAQTALKDIFGDQKFRTHHRLSAVNSVYIARVLAQCIYYLSAWLRVSVGERDNVELSCRRGISATCSRVAAPADGRADPRIKVATNRERIFLPHVHDGRISRRCGSTEPRACRWISRWRRNSKRFHLHERGPLIWRARARGDWRRSGRRGISV